MINKFVKSDLFEKKFFYLRKNSCYIDKKYRAAHGVGEGFENNKLKKRSEISIKILKELYLAGDEKSCDNKIIWFYWDSSLDDAPEVVRLSYLSWKKLNPSYKVVFLNDGNIETKLGFDFNAVFYLCSIRLTKANKSDLLRTYLLTKFGGVWADATTLCLKPLDAWIPRVKSKFDFFMFRQDEVKSRPFGVWFIYAEKGSAVIAQTFFLYLEFLLRDRKTAIYVSNSKKKMRKLGFEKLYPYKIYAKSVYEAEEHGFMPYFTLAYFFNESIDRLLSDFDKESLLSLPNNFCNNKDSVDCYLNSFVSKQTYKGDYQKSDLYLERREILISRFLKDERI